jgi:hypothetical protein
MDKLELARLIRMADRVEICQLMAKFTQYFDQFDALKILNKLMAADHPEVSVEFMEDGLYAGPEKVKAYMHAVQKYLDDPSDKRGWMALQNLANPHVVISTSGNRARGQWDVLNANAMQVPDYSSGQRKLTALWVCGRYDNEFIKVDGQWKLLKVHLVPYFKTPFDQGWLKNPDCVRLGGMSGVEPTRVSNPRSIYHSDATYSGQWLHNYGPYLPDSIDDGPAPEPMEDEATLRRIERAAAVKEIEMLQGRYLTLLESFSMARMCEELFAWKHPECCFMMCEGGEYRGPDMKRFVDACSDLKSEGNPMTVHGWFGMVDLWTPNIVVSNDGSRAKAQWNVLSPHAMAVTPYPGDEKKVTAYWFIARYDNEYIKLDGEWKILKNRVYSFARSPYELGWVRQPDARRLMHAYHGCGVEPFQASYHPDNVYSGKGPHNWGPFLPDEGEF